MGWFKVTGTNPNPNSNTPDPDDLYNAVGLAGVLTGDSDGHAVRALLEVIDVDGDAAGGRARPARRRRQLADVRRERGLADDPARRTSGCSWPRRSTSTPARWRSTRTAGRSTGFYTVAGDPWVVAGRPGAGPHARRPTRAGIKIGGSFPQNTRERNPCNCRMDSLMFLDRVATAREVRKQYELAVGRHHGGHHGHGRG